MKKLVILATMVFLSVAFASTALAGDGYNAREKLRLDLEKRAIQKENDKKSDDTAKKVENKTETRQNVYDRLTLSERRGGH